MSVNVLVSVHGVGWTSSGKREFEQSLYSCQDNDPPSRMNDSEYPNTNVSTTNLAYADVKQLCTVNFSVDESKIWLERSYRSEAVPGKWRDMTLELMVLLGNATLDYVVKYRDEFVGAVEANYVEQLS